MIISLRSIVYSLIFAPALVLAASTTPAPVEGNHPKPMAASAPALPATLDVVTFVIHSDGANHKLIVTTAPTSMRVDVPGEAYSVIYNPQTQAYTGLEHSNYTYWQFSWPEIRGAIEQSKRYSARMQELTISGLNSDSSAPSTNASASSSSVPDNNGYVWRQTTDHKKISGLDCSRWTGETVSGDSVQAWCFNGPVPKIQADVDRLQEVNEPMALVPLRPLVPPFVFPVFAALAKGGVTPVQIIWGPDRDKNSFTFVEAKTRPAKADLFTVPKLYMKTTLVSMDGLIDEKK